MNHSCVPAKFQRTAELFRRAYEVPCGSSHWQRVGADALESNSNVAEGAAEVPVGHRVTIEEQHHP